MGDSREQLRRWWGACCLSVAAGMLIWGQTVLKPRLAGTWFVVYWVGCFGFTFAAIVIALLDLRAVRRRARSEHRTLIENTLQEVDPDRVSSGDPKPDAEAGGAGKGGNQE